MCLELKGKLHTELHLVPDAQTKLKKQEDPLQLALAQLDYRKSEIDAAINCQDVPLIETAPLEERLRAALHFLAKQR
jgi:Holliday junction resolvasome RuvABC DNA-binding subunit